MKVVERDTGQPQAQRPDRAHGDGPRPLLPAALLEFRPWMLALAVFLACAIGIAIMERSRDDAAMWAQAPVADPGHR